MTRKPRLLSILSLGIAIAGGAGGAGVAEATTCIGPSMIRTSRIAGQVFDTLYGAPIPGAKVTISGPGNRVVEIETGEDGYFEPPADLVRVATTGPLPWARTLAVWRLTDRELLARIAKSDPHEGVREAAEFTLKTLAKTPPPRP
jgi:hypothetical protein